jgi:hypothetical protein
MTCGWATTRRPRLPECNDREGPTPQGFVVSRVDVDAVASAVARCPSVIRLSGGVLGEVATYLPGRRVTGVRVTDDVVEVHTVARWVDSLPAVGDEVRAVLRPLVGARSITVFIDDLADDPPAGGLALSAATGGLDGR